MSKAERVTIGETVPDFELTDVKGDSHRLADYAGWIVVLTFWSAECPVVAEYDAYFNALAARYGQEQVVVLGIDSNVNETREEIARTISERQVSFPVLRDRELAIADRLGAVTTPHVFIIDAQGGLAYAGGVDDRSFRQPEPTVQYVDQALEALLAGQSPPTQEARSYGCTIVRHGEH
jgi:peroxiredoxin